MRLADLLDPTPLGGRCPPGFDGDPGLWAAAGQRLMELGHDETAATRAFFVPGRLEVVGKHTDYAGGRSLVAATGQGFHLAVAARPGSEARFHDLGTGEEATLDLGGELTAPEGHWTAYPCAVARRLRRDFDLDLGATDAVLASTLPAAAGMSSSSALVVASWLALTASGGIDLEGLPLVARAWLAEYLAAVEAGRAFTRPTPRPLSTLLEAQSAADEAGGVGTRGGSEDHIAILCSRAERLAQYAYEPARLEREIELPFGLVFAIGASGIRARKTAGARHAYNRASFLASELAVRWRHATGGEAPHLGAILARDPGQRATLARIAAEYATGDSSRRLEHFVAESEEVVPAAGEALGSGDLAAFGRLVDRSQRLAEALLGNQVAETVHLAASAREHGAHAASAFGAGFGGAVWALVDERRSEAFLAEWRDHYLSAFPQRSANAEFLLTRPGPAAFELGAWQLV